MYLEYNHIHQIKSTAFKGYYNKKSKVNSIPVTVN